MAFRFPSPLYPIVDTTTTPGGEVDLAETILASGVGLLQLRVKERTTRDFVELARAVKRVSDRHGAALIVNDRADIALLTGAAGVHLGQDDLPPAAAREILGAGKIVGFSTHDPVQLDAAPQSGRLDYVAYGPVFRTSSKDRPDPVQGLEALAAAARASRLPLVAIGGIDAGSIAGVLSAGADAAAVIGAIGRAPNPGAATLDLLQCAATATTLPRRRRS